MKFEKTEHQALIKANGQYKLVDLYKLKEFYFFKTGGDNFIQVRGSCSTSKAGYEWTEVFCADGFEVGKKFVFEIVAKP